MSTPQIISSSRLTASVCLVAAGLLQATGAMAAPTHAHSSEMQVLRVNSPSAGSVNCLVYDFYTDTSYESEVKLGAVTEHEMPVFQYTNTQYAYENWNGIFVYDFTAASFTGAVYSIQQPLPGLPEKPAPTFNAPSNFTMTEVEGTWTASWTDNSSLEDAFIIGSRTRGSSDEFFYFTSTGANVTSAVVSSPSQESEYVVAAFMYVDGDGYEISNISNIWALPIEE